MRYSQAPLLPLTTIHVVDRNGMAETISQEEKLAQFAKNDFIKNQPYKKVMRVFARDAEGAVRAVITNYHENGQIYRYLETLNGRAYGCYKEWFDNGQLHISAQVIGGEPDTTPQAEETWLFEGTSYAWDQQGHLQAEINYRMGKLHGKATHYHTTGQVWKSFCFDEDELNGPYHIFYPDGELLQQMHYQNGHKEGEATRYWSGADLASKEYWKKDKLIEGCYFDQQGNKISEIKEGGGWRALFGKEGLCRLEQYREGKPEGVVKTYDSEGRQASVYSIDENGDKHGKELLFYTNKKRENHDLIPKLELSWTRGFLHGTVRSWYPDGSPESQREMADNKKNGLLMAWYKDGSLMMLEEYEKELLMRGEYYRRAERIPVSEVEKGEGEATIYDADGIFIRKIVYRQGLPSLTD